MNVVDITKAGYVSDAGPIETFQGGAFPGKLTIEASRSSGVSPCTIVFSAKGTTRNSYDEHQILGTGGATNVGYSWDFGDPTSGTFNTYNNTSKNTSVGGFMAAHTFEVADGGGAVTFTIACRAKDAAGNEALAFIDVTVQAQDDYYSAANTIAISNTLAATGWDALGNDRNPPTGYTEAASIGAAFTSLNIDACTGKRIMLYRGDDFSAEGANLKILSGNNNFHITWFGNENSGTTVGAAITISFTAPTEANKNAGIGGTISDSGSGLGGLTVGAEVTVSGSASNDFKFIIRSVAAGSVTVRYTGRTIATEAAGASVTLTEHNKRPEVKGVLVGVKSSGSTDVLMDDSSLASRATEFSNNGWCENVTIDGIRAYNISLGVSYQQIGIHNCDLDQEDTAAASGTNIGKINLGEGAYCWNFPANLDADSVPYVKGCYLSDTVVIGSTAQIAANSDPSVNLQGAGQYNITWHCIIGCHSRTAREMNHRQQGYHDFIIHDSDFLGQHIGGAGAKGRVLARGSGANQVSDYSAEVRGTHASDGTDELLWPYSRYFLAQYVFDSASSEGESTFSGIESSGSTLPQLHFDGLITHYTCDPNATQAPGTQLITEGCKWACFTNVTWVPASTGPEDKNTDLDVLNNGPNNVVVNGSKSTQADYLGPVYLDGISESAYNLPVPTAPR